LLEHEARYFETKAQEKGLKLTLSLCQTPCELWADVSRLKQLFHNLMNNALKYTDAPGSVEIMVDQDKKDAVIVIKDSAPSVNSEHLQKLFDPLYRVESSRNRETGGSGLGLAICKQIVLGHSGSIEADISDLGGIQITIKLPLA
jgi:two-component system sensor histidine kinase BaeS